LIQRKFNEDASAGAPAFQAARKGFRTFGILFALQQRPVPPPAYFGWQHKGKSHADAKRQK
jgi:hypothetical protein